MKENFILILIIMFCACSNNATSDKKIAQDVASSAIVTSFKPSPYYNLDTSKIKKMILPIGNTNIKFFDFSKSWETKEFKNVNGVDVAANKLDSIVHYLSRPCDSLLSLDSDLFLNIEIDSTFSKIFGDLSQYKIEGKVIPIAYYNKDSLTYLVAKDAGKHENNYDDALNPVWIKYICLIVLSKGKILNKYVIYYEDLKMYQRKIRYFYIDKGNCLYLKDFDLGESNELLSSSIMKLSK